MTNNERETWNQRTRIMLSARVADGQNLKSIAKAAGLHYRWVQKYHKNQIETPNIHMVQQLHDHLAADHE